MIRCQFKSEFKEYTLIGMRRMAQRIPTTHATNAHLVCAYADTTSWMLLPLPRAHPVFCVSVSVHSGQTWNFVHVYMHTDKTLYLRSSPSPPSLLRQKANILFFTFNGNQRHLLDYYRIINIINRWLLHQLLLPIQVNTLIYICKTF